MHLTGADACSSGRRRAARGNGKGIHSSLPVVRSLSTSHGAAHIFTIYTHFDHSYSLALSASDVLTRDSVKRTMHRAISIPLAAPRSHVLFCAGVHP